MEKYKGIKDKYYFDSKNPIGIGGYSKVYMAKELSTGHINALKIIEKKDANSEKYLKNEIKILKNLNHQNIIQSEEWFEDENYIYLLQEYCYGGSLFEEITKKTKLVEKVAKIYFKQIIKAIHYCHSNKIAHCDLKPENCLFVSKNGKKQLKLIDFGLANKFEKNGKIYKMTNQAGTLFYISPEVIKGQYDQSCDIWAAGVILYIMLAGVPPFYGDDDNQILKNILRRKYYFKNEHFHDVSKDAKDLIKQMICSPKKRLNTYEILNSN